MKATANSLNVKQSFSSSTTLGGRQTAAIECIRRHGPLTCEQLVEKMNLRKNHKPAVVCSFLSSLRRRGLVETVAMPEGAARRYREKNPLGPIPTVHTLTSSALGMRRALAAVDGTGNRLGVIVTEAPAPDALYE